jgi:hypothetical protein
MSKVNGINTGISLHISFGPDEEHRKIMRKLMAYGITPTGKKSADIELLRRIELKLAQQENCVTGKFLTVSKKSG